MPPSEPVIGPAIATRASTAASRGWPCMATKAPTKGMNTGRGGNALASECHRVPHLVDEDQQDEAGAKANPTRWHRHDGQQHRRERLPLEGAREQADELGLAEDEEQTTADGAGGDVCADARACRRRRGPGRRLCRAGGSDRPRARFSRLARARSASSVTRPGRAWADAGSPTPRTPRGEEHELHHAEVHGEDAVEHLHAVRREGDAPALAALLLHVSG